MSLAFLESFRELLGCIVLGQIPADESLYASDVLVLCLGDVDIREFLTEITKHFTSAALVESDCGSGVEIKLSFVLAVDHLHKSVGCVVALKEVVTVNRSDRREVELCIKKVVEPGDLEILGCLVTVCLGFVAVTESHEVVRADNCVGKMKSELLEVLVRGLAVTLKESVESDTLGFGLDAVRLESVTEGSVTELVLLVVHGTAHKVELPAAVHLNKMIHDLVLGTVVVGADIGKSVVTSVYTKDLSVRLSDLFKDLVNNRDRSNTVDRNKNTVVLGRIG